MALLVNSSPTPGASNLSGTSLQGSGSVGAPAQSPGSNLSAPTNSISSSQQVPTTAVKDLSGTSPTTGYADVNGTIYNKSTGQAYSTPQQFFTASGVNSFNNLKFDTTWTPPTTTSTGLQMPGSTNTPSVAQPSSQPQPVASTGTSSGLLPSLATSNTQNPTVSTTATGAPATQTPPNNGATGVSTGIIAAGQIANANNNPQYLQDQATYNQLAGQIGTTKTQEQGALYNVGNQGDTALALGRAGQVGNYYNGLLQALAGQQSAAQTAAQNAIGEQGQTNTGLASAGSLAQPIVNPQTGGLVNPTANTTTGSTTSGAQNLNSLLTITPNATGPGTASAYSAGGQTFATPQDLSNWVNQQVGNPTATNASNVFQYLQQNGGSTGNATSGASGLNPIANVGQTAQAVINGTMTYAQALAQGGTVPNYTNLLNQAITGAGGNITALQAQGAATQSNITTSGTSTVTANNAIYQQATSDLANLQANVSNIQNFGNQVIANMPSEINPTDSTVLNGTIQNLLQNYANNPQYAKLATNIQGFQARVSALLGSGEIPSAATAGAQAIANGTLPVGSMSAVVNQIMSESNSMIATQQAKVDAAKANVTAGASGSSNSTTLGLF